MTYYRYRPSRIDAECVTLNLILDFRYYVHCISMSTGHMQHATQEGSVITDNNFWPHYQVVGKKYWSTALLITLHYICCLAPKHDAEDKLYQQSVKTMKKMVIHQGYVVFEASSSSVDNTKKWVFIHSWRQLTTSEGASITRWILTVSRCQTEHQSCNFTSLLFRHSSFWCSWQSFWDLCM